MKVCNVCKKTKNKGELTVIGDMEPGTRYKCRFNSNCIDAEKEKKKIQDLGKRKKENSGLTVEEFTTKYSIDFDNLEECEVQYRDGKKRYSYNNEIYFRDHNDLWGKIVN